MQNLIMKIINILIELTQAVLGLFLLPFVAVIILCCIIILSMLIGVYVIYETMEYLENVKRFR